MGGDDVARKGEAGDRPCPDRKDQSLSDGDCGREKGKAHAMRMAERPRVDFER